MICIGAVSCDDAMCQYILSESHVYTSVTSHVGE